MNKQVKISVEVEASKKGTPLYFTIYEVRAHRRSDDKDITRDRYLNREDAIKAVDESVNDLGNIYDTAWIMEQIIWLKH